MVGSARRRQSPALDACAERITMPAFPLWGNCNLDPYRVTTNAAWTSTATLPFSMIEAFNFSLALP